MKQTFTILLLFLCLACSAQEKLYTSLEEYIQFRAEKGRYSGVTAIYEKEKLVFSSVKGEANRAWKIPNSIDTRFNLASVTKMFTATGIGILMEQGKIKLDDLLQQHWPEFPDKNIAGKITIRQLISHTSGISDFFFERSYLDFDRNRLRKLEDYDRFLNGLRLGEVPADRILYSNTNYILLGRIIEKVSGRDYYDFIQEEIFEPLSMNNSGFLEADLIIPRVAEGYYVDAQASAEFGVPNDRQVRRNLPLRAVKGMPAGGAFSTTEDLFKFFSGLRKGTLLSGATLALMTSENQGRYGLGFQTYEQNGFQLWGHSGGFYGVSTMAFYIPEKEITILSLTNTDFGAQPVVDRFFNLLSGTETYTPVSMRPEDIKPFEGHFEVYEGEMNGRQLKIEAKQDRLYFDNNLDFFPIAENQFFDIDNDLFTLTFTKDEEGKVSGFYRTDNRGYHQKARRIDASQVRSLQALQVGDDVLRQYLGDYQFEPNGMMAGHRPQLTIQNGGIMIDNMMRFVPFERDKFFQEDDIGMRLIFQRNEKGEIIGIHVMREKDVIGRVKKL